MRGLEDVFGDTITITDVSSEQDQHPTTQTLVQPKP